MKQNRECEPMKIGFDVSQTGKIKAGCGYYAENLIRNLANIDSENHYYLYSTFGDHFWDNRFKETTSINLPNFHHGINQNNHFRAKKFWHQSPQEIEKKLGNIDILHANNFFCPPKLPHAKLIYTLYDLSFIEYPDCTTEHNRIACFDGLFKASLNADLIIAISHYSRKHFLQIFPHYPEDRIVTVHPASRFNTNIKNQTKPAKLSHLQSEQFWLNVGTIEPRKNIKRLLYAYAELRNQQAQVYPLVLAGKLGWMENNIEKLIQSLDLEKHVFMLGYTEDEELQWLYQNCFCLVYPSLFEGFGLPVLEAMSFGAPIITSNVSSLPEVVGKAGLLINPSNENELTMAMQQMLLEPNRRLELKNLALEQSRTFSWANTAKNILNLYQEVIALPQRHRHITSLTELGVA